MDYTQNPENNMQPAYANFKILAELYGTVDGSPVPTDDNVAVASNSAINNTKVGGNRGRGRRGRRRLLPLEVTMALESIDDMVDDGTFSSGKHGWRTLQESMYGHAHEIDLGNGYTVQVHALKP
jgi:hypothetical protein